MILTALMAHQRKLIRNAVAALLVSANTAAGARVKATRVEPNREQELPAISVYTLSDETDRASADTAPIELTRELKLEIACEVKHTDAYPVDDRMDDIAEQVEAAMASDYWITQALAVTAVDHMTGILTVPGHGLATAGSPLELEPGAGGVLPGNVPAGDVYAIVVDADHVQLATGAGAASNGNAITLADNGTLPLNLRVGTVVDQLLTGTVMQVLEEDGKSDPLIGIVVLSYSLTFRTRPATATTPDDFLTADVTTKRDGTVSDTALPEDVITVRTP
ncbi:MAG TPA: hypothetical protein VIV58_28455 [Kofleriaceae bacterium]